MHHMQLAIQDCDTQCPLAAAFEQASDEARAAAFEILAEGASKINAADLHQRLAAWICWALGVESHASPPSQTVTAIVEGGVCSAQQGVLWTVTLICVRPIAGPHPLMWDTSL